MKDPVVHEALRQILEVVAQETGAPLQPQGRARVEKVLQSAMGQLAGVPQREQSLTLSLIHI